MSLLRQIKGENLETNNNCTLENNLVKIYIQNRNEGYLVLKKKNIYIYYRTACIRVIYFSFRIFFYELELFGDVCSVKDV